MFDLRKARRAISEEDLSGWLFFNVRHRDTVSDRILEVPPGSHNTRPWVYLVLREGQPVRLVHAVEAGILDHLPGRRIVYASREDYRRGLRQMAAAAAESGAGSRGKGKKPAGNRKGNKTSGRTGGEVAAQFSAELPVLSLLDHGSALLLKSCGFRLASSAALIQRFLGVLDEAGIESHQTAARLLYSIVHHVWNRLRVSFRERLDSNRRPLAEAEVQSWILELFERHELETDFPPLVAAGRSTADPHYSLQGSGQPMLPEEVVQLDLWARLRQPGAIYADISWVGYLAGEPDAEARRVFEVLRAARERAVAFIAEGLKAGAEIRGLEVDRHVRSFLQSRGYGKALRHRTGHAIDVEVHGCGVNLDATEFPDKRRILEGSCFSIEPGIYLSKFGMRTEINAYVRNGRLVVSGGTPQQNILCVY